MESFDRVSEQSTLSTVDATLKQALKLWAATKKSRQDWDFKTSSQILATLTTLLAELVDQWPDHTATLNAALQVDQDLVRSADYPVAVVTALQAAGVAVGGEFPNYEFPPFKLTFNIDQNTARLSMGRKSQQTKAFAPPQLAHWVAGQYHKVIASKFDSSRFCRELLSAYELLNQIEMQKKAVVWGHPIALKDIYRLLTLKQIAKQDYPEPLFTFDLARLKEQPEIRYEHYQFDLQPSRNLPSFVLINSQGQESRISTLAIHAVEE